MDDYERRRREIASSDRRRAQRWFQGLPADCRARVCATVGVAPRWVVETLHAAGLQCIPIEGPEDAEASYMLPLAVLDLVAERRDDDPDVPGTSS
ncbi:MAG: hypothetical protein JWM34_1961 [Ilumatobacteraceae bacterium]|nr:hypothetical protein [Ilumatobacteraceae bacterium]